MNIARLILTVAVAGCLASCAGHGKYTAEHLANAKTRMGELKAANEYEMARQAFLAGDLTKATKRIDSSIALAEEVPASHVLRGRIMFETGNLDQAGVSFARAIELDQGNVEAWYFKGILSERIAQLPEAEAAYCKAMELDPGNPQYAVAAAEVIIDQERYDDAEAILLQDASFQSNPGVKQTLGHISLLQRDFASAADYFNEACLLAPDDPAILEDLVRAQIELGEFGDAEANVARLRRMPENDGRRDLAHLHARCLVEVDRLLEARQILMELTSDTERTTDVQAWIDLGNLAYLLKDTIRQNQAASRVIAIKPDRYEGYMLRALAQRRDGKLPEALESVELAVDRRGDDTRPLVLNGLILEELGRADEARACYQTILDQDPANVRAAQLLQALGDRAVSTVPTE